MELHYRLLQYLLSDHQSSDVELESSKRDRDDSQSIFRLHGDMSQQVSRKHVVNKLGDLNY